MTGLKTLLVNKDGFKDNKITIYSVTNNKTSDRGL